MAAYPDDHPVQLVVRDDLRRSRLTTFFRLLLALPHVLWGFVWTLVVLVLLPFVWLIGIVLGRLPDGLHEFLAAFGRHSIQTRAYFFLVADAYPPFHGPANAYPVDPVVTPAARQPRVSVAFRWLLGIPAFVVAYFLDSIVQLLAFISWFAAVFAGRVPEGLRDAMAFCLKYEWQTIAYAMLLTPRYPNFSGPALASATAVRSAATPCPYCGAPVPDVPRPSSFICSACGGRVVLT